MIEIILDALNSDPFPFKLRIDIALASMRIILFRNDSVYEFEPGGLTSISPGAIEEEAGGDQRHRFD